MSCPAPVFLLVRTARRGKRWIRNPGGKGSSRGDRVCFQKSHATDVRHADVQNHQIKLFFLNLSSGPLLRSRTYRPRTPHLPESLYSSCKSAVHSPRPEFAPEHSYFPPSQQDREYWGRLVESAIGAYLLNRTRGKKIDVFYWLERNQEVDFLLRAGKDLVALEVKSGRTRHRLSGMAALTKAFKVKRQLLIGQESIGLEEFLTKPVEHRFAY